jgi:hypothetical protein
VVRWSEVGIAYKTKVPNDDGDTVEGKRKYAERVKKTLKRARVALLGFGVIGIDQIKGEEPYHVVWPTGKAVWGPDLRWPNGHKETAEDKPKDTDQSSLSDYF